MRLTAREQEIFDVLTKEPLISQEDLARRLGISRSSAAVHISNLMKKVLYWVKVTFLKQASVAVVGDIYLHIKVDQAQQKIDVYIMAQHMKCPLYLGVGSTTKVITVLERRLGQRNINDAAAKH